MLRRRNAKPKTVTPTPIDPSTIPEAKPREAAEEIAADAPVVDPQAPVAPDYLPEVGEPVLTSEAALGSGPQISIDEVNAPDPIEEVVLETSPDPAAVEEVPVLAGTGDLPGNIPGPLPDVPLPVVDSPSVVITPPPAVTVPTVSALPVGGIDLGGTKIAAAIIGGDHEVLAYRRRPTPDSGGPEDVVKAMVATIQEAAADVGIEAHELRAVGVGSPGAVDTATGSVSGAGNLPGWGGSFQLGTALGDALGVPVTVGNDVSVATEAEFRLGVGKQYNSLLGVFWGTGVGGGLILDGKPWNGRGKAGEIGHMVVKIGGAKCGCGNRGCMEAYAGRKSMEARAIKKHKKGADTDLFKLAETHGKPHLTSAIWAKALAHEDPLATKLLDRAVGALSAGIASAVNLTDPECVVIGGGLGVRFADTLVPKIVEGMQEHLFDSENPPPVKVAALGDEGGVIGASLLVD